MVLFNPKKTNRRIGTLLFLAGLCVIIAACSISPNPDEGPNTDLNKDEVPCPALDPNQNQKYMELAVNYPESVRSRLITVKEYKVTSLHIKVFDPAGNLIQPIINWTPDDGSQRYQVPVTQTGVHRVEVTHVSMENLERVEAAESADFNISPMIITVVNIIPGCIGFINIDYPEQNVITMVKNEIIPSLIQQAEDTRYMVRRMDLPLKTDSIIMEDTPRERGEEPLLYKVEEDSYFYFMDLAPGAYYEHPVKYIIVSKDGEKVKTIDAKWWPKINEEAPPELVKLVPEERNIIERNVTILKPELTTIKWEIKNPDIFMPMEREAFIIVQGLMPAESCYTDAVNTYNNGYNFFNTYKTGFSTVVGLQEGSADNVITQINSLAGTYNPVSIYIIAHGSNDRIRLGGVHVYASDFANAMSSNSTTNFNFMLGSCHGGSFVDDLDDIANVRAVTTACSSYESAYPDWDSAGSYNDSNPGDTGSEWTSSLIQAANNIVNNTTLWNDIISDSATYGVHRTCILIDSAGYLAYGRLDGSTLPAGTSVTNYDLTELTDYSTPQHFRSW